MGGNPLDLRAINLQSLLDYLSWSHDHIMKQGSHCSNEGESMSFVLLITLEKKLCLLIDREEHGMSGYAAHERHRRARVEILDASGLIDAANDLPDTNMTACLVVGLDIV